MTTKKITIDYYPESDFKTKFFLDSQNLDGVLLSEDGIERLRGSEVEEDFFMFNMKIPKVGHYSDMTRHSPKYRELKVEVDLWDRLKKCAMDEDFEEGNRIVQGLEKMIPENPYWHYKETNEQYEKREIVIV